MSMSSILGEVEDNLIVNKLLVQGRDLLFTKKKSMKPVWECIFCVPFFQLL